MKKNSEPPEKAGEKFFSMLTDLLINASYKRLNFLSRRSDISWREITSQDAQTRFRWTFSIALNLDTSWIHFKCFFSTDAGLDLIQIPPGIGHDKIPMESYHSLFGEFCNLVGGAVQRAMTEAFPHLRSRPGQELSSIGLPLKELVRIPHNVFQEGGDFEKIWAVEWPTNGIICYYNIHVPGPKMKEILKEMAERKVEVLVLDEEDHIELL